MENNKKELPEWFKKWLANNESLTTDPDYSFWNAGAIAVYREYITAYEEVLSDHKKLVREIDVIINGNNAAKQASLCDLVGQIKELVKSFERL